MGPCLLGALQAAQSVTVVYVRHRPFGREAHGFGVDLEPLFQLTSRTEHDRVVELRFGAARNRVVSRAPEDQVIGIVERMKATRQRLEAEKGSHQARAPRKSSA